MPTPLATRPIPNVFTRWIVVSSWNCAAVAVAVAVMAVAVEVEVVVVVAAVAWAMLVLMLGGGAAMLLMPMGLIRSVAPWLMVVTHPLRPNEGAGHLERHVVSAVPQPEHARPNREERRRDERHTGTRRSTQVARGFQCGFVTTLNAGGSSVMPPQFPCLQQRPPGSPSSSPCSRFGCTSATVSRGPPGMHPWTRPIV